MKIVLLFALSLPLLAGDLERFLDVKLTYTARNEACLALSGNKSAEVVEAMGASLANTELQACAGANLRKAGATKELLNALANSDPAIRALAARELGTLQNPKFRAALRHAADDKDVLVASNAIEGLVRYEDRSSAPQLREIALKSGVISSLALSTLITWNDPSVLEIGRKLLAGTDPSDQLAGVRAIGIAGDVSDVPKLRELAKDDTALASGSRGFGLMPAISISRAAKLAIEKIEARAAK